MAMPGAARGSPDSEMTLKTGRNPAYWDKTCCFGGLVATQAQDYASGQLTGAEFAGESLRQLTALGKLFPEALAQVVINVIAPEEVLKGFYCIFCVLGQKITNTPSFSDFLTQI